jgi:peroxiredoxin Q/BCP
MKPQPGAPAPDFTARVTGVTTAEDGLVSLRDLRGKRVVLVFYPKDRTPGCTLQACALRNAWEEVSANTHVFGISADPQESHRRFIEQHRLPYPLIADEDHAISTAYGVWVRKSLLFYHFMGVERSTFVIDPDGIIQTVLEKVSPIRHLALLRKALA